MSVLGAWWGYRATRTEFSELFRKDAMKKQNNQSGEPLAYCQRCKEWKPMRCLPKNERKKNFESWFECAQCGCRQLSFRYIYQ